MYSEHEVYTARAWMYNHRFPDTRAVRPEFKEGVQQFLTQAINYQRKFTQNYGNHIEIFCPCVKCNNRPYRDPGTVWKHLINRGFTPNYFVWFSHGEDSGVNVPGSSSSYNEVGDEPSTSNHNQGQYSNEFYESNQYGYGNQDGNRFHDMVGDAFNETTASFTDNSVEEPNLEARRFYDMLDAANEPLYEGCREGLSKLSLASRMMTIKAEHNESEVCMDKWAALFKEYLPEGNNAAESYYDIQKLVSSLGLPAQTIDVCIDYCMLFWRDDENLQACRFCGKPRYKETGGRARVPYQRMWYLPLTDRLKRLYQSEDTY